MSRIGKQAILIPQGVTITNDNGIVKVTGPKGDLVLTLRPEIELKVQGSEANASIKAENKAANAYWGLTRALIANMVKGVTVGFEKKLELIGVGYRAKAIANGVSLAVGYSHPVEFVAPKGIEITVVDTQNITIKGSDKQQVGLLAAQIRKIRKPEPYKGKGIKYAGEFIRRKAGKSGKV